MRSIVDDLGKGYSRVQANEDMQHINSVWGLDWTVANIRSEKIQLYSKGWCTTFFKKKKLPKALGSVNAFGSFKIK